MAALTMRRYGLTRDKLVLLSTPGLLTALLCASVVERFLFHFSLSWCISVGLATVHSKSYRLLHQRTGDLRILGTFWYATHDLEHEAQRKLPTVNCKWDISK